VPPVFIFGDGETVKYTRHVARWMTDKGPAISEAPPGFSPGKVIGTLLTKRLGALDDPEQGPHVHLLLELLAILVVSGVIILATAIIL